MDEDIVIPLAGMLMIIVLSIGVPLVIGLIRRWDREAKLPRTNPESAARLERIEQAVDAMAIEVERISEGQRFVTKLMTDQRHAERAAIPAGGEPSRNQPR